MNGCDLETRSCIATDRIICRRTTGLTGFRTTGVDAWFNGPGDAHIASMGGWSTSLTRFGVAKLRAAATAMQKHTMALGFRWLLNAALQAMQAAPEDNLCDSPRYSADSRYIQDITARHGLLSVTESVALPP